MSAILANKIKELAYEKRLSIMALEREAGLKTGSIRNIVTGQSKKPSADLVWAISKALGCSIGDLLDDEEPKSHSRKKQDIKEIVFSNVSLLRETLSFISSFYETETDKYPTNKQLLDAIQGIYTYCLETNGGSFDQRFAKWFLKRDTSL